MITFPKHPTFCARPGVPMNIFRKTVSILTTKSQFRCSDKHFVPMNIFRKTVSILTTKSQFRCSDKHFVLGNASSCHFQSDLPDESYSVGRSSFQIKISLPLFENWSTIPMIVDVSLSAAGQIHRAARPACGECPWSVFVAGFPVAADVITSVMATTGQITGYEAAAESTPSLRLHF
jgi:hypothetical protein